MFLTNIFFWYNIGIEMRKIQRFVRIWHITSTRLIFLYALYLTIFSLIISSFSLKSELFSRLEWWLMFYEGIGSSRYVHLLLFWIFPSVETFVSLSIVLRSILNFSSLNCLTKVLAVEYFICNDSDTYIGNSIPS